MEDLMLQIRDFAAGWALMQTGTAGRAAAEIRRRGRTAAAELWTGHS